MATPIITSVTREVFETVPGDLKEASYALGATRWEMLRRSCCPTRGPASSALSILGLGRAIGEAIAVAQVIGGASRHSRLALPHRRHPRRPDRLPVPGQPRPAETSLAYLGLILLVFALIVNVDRADHRAARRSKTPM